MNIEVLYEDDTLVVINKPAGLIVHSDGRTKEKTLVDWIVGIYPEMQCVGEVMHRDGIAIVRPGIVHRLDRDTSGVLVLARSAESFFHLKEAFQSRQIKKEYRAFVYGVIKEEKGTIDRPIGKSASDFRAWSAQRGARGILRDAVTNYSVLLRGRATSYLALFPETGRTHQIRVHMKAVHHPVVCDALYAPKRECLLDFGRQALHAYKITLTLLSGEQKTFEAPLPEDFTNGIDTMK